MKRQTLILLICLLMTVVLTPGFAGPQDPPEVSKAVDSNGVPLPGQMIVPVPERLETGNSATITPPAVTAVDPNVVTLIGQLDEDLVLGYLEDLVAFGPRVTGSQAVDKARRLTKDVESKGAVLDLPEVFRDRMSAQPNVVAQTAIDIMAEKRGLEENKPDQACAKQKNGGWFWDGFSNSLNF